jgi:hypothetical protein
MGRKERIPLKRPNHSQFQTTLNHPYKQNGLALCLSERML